MPSRGLSRTVPHRGSDSGRLVVVIPILWGIQLTFSENRRAVTSQMPDNPLERHSSARWSRRVSGLSSPEGRRSAMVSGYPTTTVGPGHIGVLVVARGHCRGVTE